MDSREHGNYMDEETISMLADSHTVWVPTLVTVRNLLGCGRYEDEVLLPIIRQAETMVRTAFRKKVKVALGSDAGAYCVPHGKGICQEYQSFQEILGDSDEVREWLENGEKIRGEQVLVATGGNSYQSTGSTGDGYRMAKEGGHTVTDLQPSLVPMVTAEEYIPRLQGLSLKNVTLSLYDGKKCVYEDFGEMMFTHFGITGPLVLSASAKVGKLLKKKYLTARIDLKPALTAEQLDARLLREFEEGKNKQFKNVAGSLFPAKLLPVMLDLGGIAPGKKVHEITREERAGFIEKTKAFPFTVTGLRGFQEAIITKGGVQVKEVDPKTMESKKTKGLYFAGEVLDLDALTGGYNLQIAWSTAHAAAMAAAEAER